MGQGHMHCRRTPKVGKKYIIEIIVHHRSNKAPWTVTGTLDIWNESGASNGKQLNSDFLLLVMSE